MSLRLYHSPLGIFPFQAEADARLYHIHDGFLIWDLGLGKGHASMQTASLLFEDDLIDRMLVICEQSKLEEWKTDLATFMPALSSTLYYGPKRKTLDLSEYQALVSTYETVRDDATHRVKVKRKGRRKPTVQMSIDAFTEAWAGQRIFVVYDEMTKLKGRGSMNHRSHQMMVGNWRRTGEVRMVGLTGTPIENTPEDFYNMARILCPERMPTVKDFEDHYVRSFDQYGNAYKFKNLTPETVIDDDVTPFISLFNDKVLRKSKNDPDVRDQFPEEIEQFRPIALHRYHQEAYEAIVRDYKEEANPMDLWRVLRQFAGHPCSLLHSETELAMDIVERIGADTLELLKAAKTDYLVDYLEPLVNGQGAQVIVFDFYGQSVLPHVVQSLAEHFPVVAYHGELTKGQKDEAKATFRSGQARVMVSSDSGQRGINLPEASYVVHHGPPVTYATYKQRIGRASRIDGGKDMLTSRLLWARDTVEEGIVGLIMKRNRWHEMLVDGDESSDDGEHPRLTAEGRAAMIAISRKNPSRIDLPEAIAA